MRGFPSRIGCIQDLVNLKHNYSEEVIEYLQQLLIDSELVITRVVSGSEETNDLVLEEIINPAPRYLHIGFTSVQEIDDMIREVEAIRDVK